jgi:hypothetical protein
MKAKFALTALVAGLAAVCVAWPAASAIRPSAAAANSSSYADAAGDGGTAPDVTNVTISNDDGGAITLQATIANRPALGAQDAMVVFMDTNGNLSDGVKGMDYMLISSGGAGTALASLSSGKPAPVATQNPLSGSFSGGVATITFNRADLGSPSQLNLWIGTTGDGGDTVGDFAPNNGTWSYQVVVGGPAPQAPPSTTPPPPPPAQPLTLQVDKLTVGKAKAGGPFLVGVVVERTDSRDLLNGGQVACSAQVGNSPLRSIAKTGPKAGIALCTWAIPKTAHSKRITGSISITYNGVKVAKPFSARIA